MALMLDRYRELGLDSMLCFFAYLVPSLLPEGHLRGSMFLVELHRSSDYGLVMGRLWSVSTIAGPRRRWTIEEETATSTATVLYQMPREEGEGMSSMTLC